MPLEKGKNNREKNHKEDEMTEEKERCECEGECACEEEQTEDSGDDADKE